MTTTAIILTAGGVTALFLAVIIHYKIKTAVLERVADEMCDEHYDTLMTLQKVLLREKGTTPPLYDDGSPWAADDLVDFKTLSDTWCRGVIELRPDDRQNPIVIKTFSERTFTPQQVLSCQKVEYTDN